MGRVLISVIILIAILMFAELFAWTHHSHSKGISGAILLLYGPFILTVIVFICGSGFRRRISSGITIVCSIILFAYIQKLDRQASGFVVGAYIVLFPFICAALFAFLFTAEAVTRFFKDRGFRGWWGVPIGFLLLAVILYAFWGYRFISPLLRGSKYTPPKVIMVPKTPENSTTPDGTPSLYLTLEQQLNPANGSRRKSTPEERKAQHKGAKAKFKICVVDSTRTPVPDANVEVSFYPHDYTTPKIYAGTSNKDGLCSFEGKTTAFVLFRVSKEGYYTTELQHYVYIHNADWNCVKDGKWQPWNATLELVLKEKRAPTAFHVKFLEIPLPQKNVPYGFDCVVGDVVEPVGKGKTADLIFTYSGERRNHLDYNIELRIETVNGGGFIRGTSDMWSELKSPYTAPEAGYVSPTIIWMRKIPDVRPEDSCLKKDEHLIFETYSRGGQPCVGKIYGEVFINQSFKYPEGASTSSFLYFFNLVSGDRRLESDPDKNLFGRSGMTIEQQP